MAGVSHFFRVCEGVVDGLDGFRVSLTRGWVRDVVDSQRNLFFRSTWDQFESR